MTLIKDISKKITCKMTDFLYLANELPASSNMLRSLIISRKTSRYETISNRLITKSSALTTHERLAGFGTIYGIITTNVISIKFAVMTIAIIVRVFFAAFSIVCFDNSTFNA